MDNLQPDNQEWRHELVGISDVPHTRQCGDVRAREPTLAGEFFRRIALRLARESQQRVDVLVSLAEFPGKG